MMHLLFNLNPFRFASTRQSLICSLTLMGLLQNLASAATPMVANYPLSQEPPQLNSLKATDIVSFFVLGHVMEGLTRYGNNGEPVPGVATRWKIDDKTATFWLRKNAKWSDGKPVTAQDFIFAWKTALDPKTASEYAFILYPIKNAEAYNHGKATAGDLGVTAQDPYTLVITFEKPCGYFINLTGFATFFPVREDFYRQQKDRYGADANRLLYNGPFQLTEWSHGASLKLDKNPNYWNTASIRLDGVHVPYMTPDNNARFNFFKDGKVDLLETLGKDDLPKAQQEKFKVNHFSDGIVLFMEFNFRDGHPTRNLNLRKAIAAVFNPKEFVSSIISIPNTLEGKGLIPQWVNGAKRKFRQEYPIAGRKPDWAAAKKYVELAKNELGGSIPPLVWLTGDTPIAGREAEYFQRELKTKLGLDLKIDKQIFKQRLAKMTAGDFDIVSAGWAPDYGDPMTFAELMASWNENNRGHYSNAEYDRLIRVAQNTANTQTRMESMARAEKIALDELAVLPTYERSVMWIVHDRLRGVIRHQVGPDPDFTAAWIVQ